jgi:hypothetical protein
MEKAKKYLAVKDTGLEDLKATMNHKFFHVHASYYLAWKMPAMEDAPNFHSIIQYYLKYTNTICIVHIIFIQAPLQLRKIAHLSMYKPFHGGRKEKWK